MEMAEARCRFQWKRTSALMALLANCHRDPKKQRKEFGPDDFNPYETRKRVKRDVSPDTFYRAVIRAVKQRSPSQREH